MSLETFPLQAILIAVPGVLEQGLAQKCQETMLKNDTHENRSAYGQALYNWATATNRTKKSRVWEYIKKLRDPNTTSDSEAIRLSQRGTPNA
jgi:hypothetical protein